MMSIGDFCSVSSELGRLKPTLFEEKYVLWDSGSVSVSFQTAMKQKISGRGIVQVLLVDEDVPIQVDGCSLASTKLARGMIMVSLISILSPEKPILYSAHFEFILLSAYQASFESYAIKCHFGSLYVQDQRHCLQLLYVLQSTLNTRHIEMDVIWFIELPGCGATIPPYSGSRIATTLYRPYVLATWIQKSTTYHDILAKARPPYYFLANITTSKASSRTSRPTMPCINVGSTHAWPGYKSLLNTGTCEAPRV